MILGGYGQVALENLALREQLAIFQRSARRPKIRPTDRLFWVCLRKVWKEWKSALVIVRPETVLDWQRKRFRRYWSRLSQHKNPGRPRTHADIRKLVKTMAEANVGWGAPRIHGELLKLGIEVSERTVSRLMPKRSTAPSLWKMTPLWESKRRGFPQRFGKACWLFHISAQGPVADEPLTINQGVGHFCSIKVGQFYVVKTRRPAQLRYAI